MNVCVHMRVTKIYCVDVAFPGILPPLTTCSWFPDYLRREVRAAIPIPERSCPEHISYLPTAKRSTELLYTKHDIYRERLIHRCFYCIYCRLRSKYSDVMKTARARIRYYADSNKSQCTRSACIARIELAVTSFLCSWKLFAHTTEMRLGGAVWLSLLIVILAQVAWAEISEFRVCMHMYGICVST